MTIENRDALILEHLPLAKFLARRTAIRWHGQIDEVQAHAAWLLTKILEEIRTGERPFDGENLGGYINRTLSFELKDFVFRDRLFNVNRRTAMRYTIELNTSAEGITIDPEMIIVKEILESLEPRERAAVEGTMAGYLDSEIGEQLGVAGDTVRAIRKKVAQRVEPNRRMGRKVRTVKIQSPDCGRLSWDSVRQSDSVGNPAGDESRSDDLRTVTASKQGGGEADVVMPSDD